MPAATAPSPLNKFRRIALCLRDIVGLLPLRLRRVAGHLRQGPQALRSHYPAAWREVAWGVELVVLLLDVLGLPEVYSVLGELVKPRTRGLNARERALAQRFFGEGMPYHRIAIDQGAWLGPPQGRFCYVSFGTINLWGQMSDCLLVHELVHVWQFHRWGSVYIPRALVAQRSAAGYNYGGLGPLKIALAGGWGLASFNAEQQADVVADYCRLWQGLPARWAPGACADDLPVYEQLISDFMG